MSWTKLESANILFKRRRQGNMGSLLDHNANGSHSTFSSWSSPRYDSIKDKEIQRNTLKYFWSFWFFWKKANKKEKQRREKLFTQENSHQAKEEQGNLFGFSF